MLNNPALWERVDQDTYFKVFNIFAVMFVCAQFVALVDRSFSYSFIKKKLVICCLIFWVLHAGYISPVIGCKRVNKKSWRFHTKYCYWFQKVESKVITKDCEQGKFVYFNPDEWYVYNFFFWNKLIPFEPFPNDLVSSSSLKLFLL